MTLRHEPDMRHRAERVAAAAASALGRERGGPIPLALVSGAYMAFEALLVSATSALTGVVYYAWAFNSGTVSDIHLELGALVALLVVAASLLQGTYRPDRIHAIADQPDRLALSIIFGLSALVMVLFFTKRSVDYSRMVIFISGVLTFFVLLVARRRASQAMRWLVREGWVRLPRLVLIGHRDLLTQLIEDRDPERTHRIVGTVEVAARGDEASLEEALATARRTAQAQDADAVLCLPWSERQIIERAVERLAALPSSLFLFSDPYLRRITNGNGAAHSLGHTIVRRPLSRTQVALKRAFDILGAGLGLLLISPLLIVITLLIKLDSSGPVLFRQLRYGYNRVPFQVFKFRTMTAESSREGFRQATRHDARVTRVGRFLRKTSLDELPQLFNVLGGSMSLVGPRPHPVELDEQFAPLISHYSTRHRIKPGITGWAQVKGHRGETGSTGQMADRIAHDLYYLNNWSFWLDIKILFMTLASVATQRNAV